MSEFRKIVEEVLKENNINLKEWDDPAELKYQSQHPEDHTGEHEIDFDLDLPLNDNLRSILVSGGIANQEDLINDETGMPENMWPDADVKVEYDIEGYPDDEEVVAKKVYLKTYTNGKPGLTDITAELPEGYLSSVSKELENFVDLHTYDDTAELRRDYYKSVL